MRPFFLPPQRYCLDFPDDSVCSPPDCLTADSVLDNLNYCDVNVCSAFFPPSTAVGPSRILCDEVCSPAFLGPLGTVETRDQRASCQHRCTDGGGVNNSYLCLQYCKDFPTDPVCAPYSAQAITKILDTPACLPGDFLTSMAYCDANLCSPFLWRDALLPSDTLGLQSCREACSPLALGPPDGTALVTPAVDDVLKQCRLQCATMGYHSYVCQVKQFVCERQRGRRLPLHQLTQSPSPCLALLVVDRSNTVWPMRTTRSAHRPIAAPSLPSRPTSSIVTSTSATASSLHSTPPRALSAPSATRSAPPTSLG